MDLTEFRTQFPAGDFLFQEGEVGDCAYIIETGLVEVSIQKNDRKLIIATLGEGDLLGEMAIIDNMPRTATAQAIEDTQVVAIPLAYVHQKVDYSDPTVKFFLQIVLERYRDVHSRLMQVFEGLSPSSDETYHELYASTTNVVKNLMAQYLDLQDRMLSAVNTSLDESEHHHDDATAWQAKNLLEAEQALTNAMRNEEFRVDYQPIVNLKSRQIVGCEALVRWQHPQKGIIYPSDFIEQAENIGLIVDLGYWIMRTACRFQKRLSETIDRPLFVSINLSGKQFEDPDLIARLEEIMGFEKVSPELIKYEITESLLLNNPGLATEYLHKIKATGARLAIDDFGTGYSSFSYLHQFPFDTLKIDRAFISTMVPNRKSQQIVKSLVNLSHDLHMDVVAEGVETSFEEELLQRLGTEYAQGFFYASALEEDDFIELIEKS